MMLLKEFLAIDEWQKMRDAMYERLQQAISDAMSATTIQEKEYYHGVANTWAEAIDLPKMMIPEEPDGKPKDKLPKPNLGEMFIMNRKSLDEVY